MKILMKHKLFFMVILIVAILLTTIICNYCIVWDNKYTPEVSSRHCTAATLLVTYRHELYRYDNIKLLHEIKLNGKQYYSLNISFHNVVPSYINDNIHTVDDDQLDDVVIRIYYLTLTDMNLYPETNITSTVGDATANIDIKCLEYKLIQDNYNPDVYSSNGYKDQVVVLITKKADISLNTNTHKYGGSNN